MPGETETQQPSAGRNRWTEADAGNDAPDLVLPKPDRVAGKINDRDPQSKPAYYDLSILKPPVWTPEVAAYFFLGGMSAGAYILGRLADRFGGEPYRGVAKTGSYVAAAAALPCAPLLILDLGDPKRFHHMLRVFKPQSPMNVGSWTLTAYTVFALGSALREWLRAGRSEELKGIARFADAGARAAEDAVGIPVALLLAGYTGVLLSTTSTPVWCKNPWLGALFTAGAMSTGGAAVRLALLAPRLISRAGEDTAVDEALQKTAAAGHIAEAIALAGYVAAAGPLAKPLAHGKLGAEFLGGAVCAGLVASEILERVSVPARLRAWTRFAGIALTLVGGFALRHSIVSAGRPSAEDPDAAREVSSAGRNA